MRHRPRILTSAVAITLLFTAASCQPTVKSIAPNDLALISGDTVASWVSDYTPRTQVRFDLKWRFQNDRGAAGGKAAARIAPPDSLRFDYRGMLGKSGKAAVVGSAAIWSAPEADFKDILQSAPLFWAALGVPVRPPAGAQTWGARSATRRAWRYAVGVDTFDFIDQRDLTPRRLLAEMRRRGTIIGMVQAQFDSSGIHIANARMDFPAAQSRFSLTLEGVDSTEKFGPETWARP